MGPPALPTPPDHLYSLLAAEIGVIPNGAAFQAERGISRATTSMGKTILRISRSRKSQVSETPTAPSPFSTHARAQGLPCRV